jgi:ABC-type Fe3+/spermidine/putrescine transport system ATPase subunit
MSFVTIDSLTKSYGDVVALDDVSIAVEDGEFVSVLGPSGSGKTTMLKSIAGFVEPDSGSVTVGDTDVLGLPPEDRNMGLVFQRLALFPHISVYDNVAFGLRHRHDLSESEIEEKVGDILEVVSLPGYQERAIGNLSGGEQQRVALARVLVLEPDLLLYDEPLSDLDRQLREQMRREIKDLHDQLGITSIYVTHNQREALTLSNRILVLNEGERVRYASPSEIYQSPQSQFCADFVGDSNFLEGEVVRKNSHATFETGTLSLPIEAATASTDGELLYVRPEDISLRPATDDAQYSAEITSVVHLGSVTEYRARVGDHDFLATDLGAPEYREGGTVAIEFEDYGMVTA